jgi:hypothetical protein
MRRLDLDLTPILNFGEFLFGQRNAINVVAGSNGDWVVREDAAGCKCITFEFRGWVRSTFDSPLCAVELFKFVVSKSHGVVGVFS